MKRFLIVPLLAVAACSTGVDAKVDTKVFDGPDTTTLTERVFPESATHGPAAPVDGWAAFHGLGQP